MIAFSWSTIKGDWWKSREEEKAKFISAEWDKEHKGLYIGRFAIVKLTKDRKEDQYEP